jgi:hypothetical protein
MTAHDPGCVETPHADERRGTFIDLHKNPKPFKWTKSADQMDASGDGPWLGHLERMADALMRRERRSEVANSRA